MISASFIWVDDLVVRIFLYGDRDTPACPACNDPEQPIFG